MNVLFIIWKNIITRLWLYDILVIRLSKFVFSPFENNQQYVLACSSCDRMQETIRHIYIWNISGKVFTAYRGSLALSKKHCEEMGLIRFQKKLYLLLQQEAETKNISKTTNEFNVLTDIQVVRSESVVNLLENKYDAMFTKCNTGAIMSVYYSICHVKIRYRAKNVTYLKWNK